MENFGILSKYVFLFSINNFLSKLMQNNPPKYLQKFADEKAKLGTLYSIIF